MTRRSARSIHTVSLLLACLLCAAFSQRAYADSLNRVKQLSLESPAPDTTQLLIRVAHQPTFSVYPLRNPPRLLVEVADCVSDDAVAPLSSTSGALSSVAVQPSADTSSPTCRIILSAHGAALPRYDIDTVDSAIYISLSNPTAAPSLTAAPTRDAADDAAAADAASLAQANAVRAEAAQANAAKAEADLAAARLQLSQAQTSLTDLQRNRAVSLDRLSQLEAQLDRLSSDAHADRQRLSSDLQRARDAHAQASHLSTEQSALVASLQGQLSSLQASDAEHRQRLSALSSERDLASSRARDAERKATALSSQVDALSLSLQQRRDQDAQAILSLEQQVSLSQTSQKSLQQELSSLRAQLSQSQTDHAATDALISQKAQASQAATQQLDALQRQLSDARDAAQSSQSTLQGQLSSLESSLTQERARAQQLERDRQTQAAAFTSQIAQRDAALRDQQGQLDALQSREQSLRQQLSDARARAEQAESHAAQVSQLQRSLAAAQGDAAQTRQLQLALDQAKAAQAQAAQAQTSEISRLQQELSSAQAQAAQLSKLQQELSSAQAQAAQLSKLQQELAQAQAQAQAQASDAQARAAQAESLRQQLAQAQAQASDAQASQSHDAQAQAAQAESLRQQLAQAQTQAAQARADAQAAQAVAELAQARATQAEMGKADAQARATQAEMGKADAQARATQAEISAADTKTLATELSSLRAKLKDAESQASQAQTAQQHLQQQLAQAQTQADDALALRRKLHDAEAQAADADALRLQLADLSADAKSNSSEAKSLRRKLSDAEAQAAEAQSLRTKLRDAEAQAAQAHALQRKLSAAEAQAAEAQSLRAKLRDAEAQAALVSSLHKKLKDAEAQAADADALRQQLADLSSDAKTNSSEARRLRRKLKDSDAIAIEAENLRADLSSARRKLASAEAEAQSQALRAQAAEATARAASAPPPAPLDTAAASSLSSPTSPPPAALAQHTPDPAPAPLDLRAEALLAQAPPALPPAFAAPPPAASPPLDLSPSFAASPPADPSPVAAASPPASSSQTQIQDLRFEQHGDTSRLIISFSGAGVYDHQRWSPERATLLLDDADLPEPLRKKIDARAHNGAVLFVSSLREDNAIRLVAELSGQSDEVIRRHGNTLIWEFTQRSNEPPALASAPLDPPEATINGVTTRFDTDRRDLSPISAAPPPSSRFDRSSDPGLQLRFGERKGLRTRLSKRRVTLNIRDADINDLLRLLADVAEVSIITSPDVKGNVTLALKSVPLDQALSVILKSQGLGMEQEGNVLWVAPLQVFIDRDKAAFESTIKAQGLAPLEVRLLPVNYARAKDLQKNVQDLLSERGKVQIDERTNTLIIKDVADNLNAAEVLVDSLDTQTPQILIEARIVETQSNFRQEFGVQWGGDFAFSPQNGNPTGLAFPSSIGVGGGAGGLPNGGTSTSPNFAVNLPAPAGQGSGGAIGMAFGSVGGTFNLNLRLSALEESGFVKIVSAPRIVTLDNIQASIEQGVSIPVSVVSAAGVQTVFFDAKLNLSVTPHATKDGNIFLNIDVTKNEPDFSRLGAQGDPSIIRKEAHTQMLVPDGDTTVIGGIYTRNTSQSMRSVPWFGRIPILGYFFRNTSEADDRTELLIFITPRIVNRDASIGVSGPGSFLAPDKKSGKDNDKTK